MFHQTLPAAVVRCFIFPTTVDAAVDMCYLPLLQGCVSVTDVTNESPHNEEGILFSSPNGTSLVTIATQTAEAFLPLDYKDGSREQGNQNLAALYHGGWALDSGQCGKGHLLYLVCVVRGIYCI